MAYYYFGHYILVPETIPDEAPIPQAPADFRAFWSKLSPAVLQLIAAAPLQPAVNPVKLCDRLLQYLLQPSPKYGCPRYLSFNHPASQASHRYTSYALFILNLLTYELAKFLQPQSDDGPSNSQAAEPDNVIYLNL